MFVIVSLVVVVGRTSLVVAVGRTLLVVAVGRTSLVVVVGRMSADVVGERKEDMEEEEELFGGGLLLGVELVVFVGFFFGFVPEKISIFSALA